MVQRSDRETRVLIVEGINTDKREEDYSRKFQVCFRFIQQSLHHEQVLATDVFVAGFPERVGRCLRSVQY